MEVDDSILSGVLIEHVDGGPHIAPLILKHIKGETVTVKDIADGAAKLELRVALLETGLLTESEAREILAFAGTDRSISAAYLAGVTKLRLIAGYR